MRLVADESCDFAIVRAFRLDVTDCARDYIHLYRGDSTALGQSLDRIQRTAAAILSALGPGGEPCRLAR